MLCYNYRAKSYNTNMVTKKNKTSTRRLALLVIGALALAALACVGTYALSGTLFGWHILGTHDTPTSTSGNNPPSKEQIDSGSAIKENSLVNSGGSGGSDQPEPPASQQDGRKLVQVDITSVDNIGTATRVGVIISALDQLGTCSMKVSSSSGETLYTSSVGVQAMSSTSTCKGFDIPNSDLTDSHYSIVINYSNNDKYGVAHYEAP